MQDGNAPERIAHRGYAYGARPVRVGKQAFIDRGFRRERQEGGILQEPDVTGGNAPGPFSEEQLRPAYSVLRAPGQPEGLPSRSPHGIWNLFYLSCVPTKRMHPDRGKGKTARANSPMECIHGA